MEIAGPDRFCSTSTNLLGLQGIAAPPQSPDRQRRIFSWPRDSFSIETALADNGPDSVILDERRRKNDPSGSLWLCPRRWYPLPITFLRLGAVWMAGHPLQADRRFVVLIEHVESGSDPGSRTGCHQNGQISPTRSAGWPLRKKGSAR